MSIKNKTIPKMPHDKRSPTWWNYYVKANYHLVADMDLSMGQKIKYLSDMARNQGAKPRRSLTGSVARLLRRSPKSVASHCQRLSAEECAKIANCMMTKGKVRSPYCRKNRKWVGPLSQQEYDVISYHEGMKELKRRRRLGI